MGRGTLCVLIAVVIVHTCSRTQEKPYSLAVYGSFTTSSKIFHHANDPDENIRNQFYPIDDIFGAGIDLRRSIEALSIQIGINVDYIAKSEKFNFPITSTRTVPASDGFISIPVELSGYFIIPVGDDNIRLYMGGGFGVYIGHRRYSIADVEAPALGKNVQIGIHVVSGVQYVVIPSVALRSELKFRNVQFETTNKFLQSSAQYRGTTVSLPQQPIVSRVNIDGMLLTLGIVYTF